MKRDTNLFVQDILDYAKDIEDFSRGLTKEEFISNRLKQSAIIRCLEVIGEAVKNIPDSFREKYPEIPWKTISGFRDVLSHAYFGVILDRVWNIIKKDLPILKKQVEKIKFD